MEKQLSAVSSQLSVNGRRPAGMSVSEAEDFWTNGITAWPSPLDRSLASPEGAIRVLGTLDSATGVVDWNGGL
jgi:hypothetical protein